MSDLVTLIVGGLATFAGGAGFQALLTYLQSRDKSQGEQRLKEIEQPIEHYSDLVDRLEKRIDRLEESDRKCREENAALHGEIGELRGKVSAQQDMISQWISEAHKATAEVVIQSARSAGSAEQSAKHAADSADSAILKASQLASRDQPVPVEIVKDSSALNP